MSQPRKPKVFNTLNLDEPSRGRFNLELDSDDENELSVVQDIRERFPGFFEYPEKCQPYLFENGCEAYSTEDGFPQTLDLSAYYKNGDNAEKKPREGMSIFSTEYERLHGNLSEAEIPFTSEATTFDQIERENIARIKNMDEDEIHRSLNEIYERLDPKTIDFLRNRSKEKSEKPKISLFKQRSQKAKVEEKVENQIVKETKNDEFIKQLEVIPDDVFGKDEQLQEYSRLAMGPMHMDFARKNLHSMVSSHERNLIRFFEKLKIPPKNYDGSDELINLARESMDKIPELYLEEFVNNVGKKERRFAKDVNPLVNSSWSFVPIRRVVDAQGVRGDTNQNDDREIVELALLWTVLLFREQPIYFNLVHGTPGDIYTRLAEIYLLGPDIFKSSTIEKCIDVMVHEFLIPKASEGKLSLKATKGISGLDAFLPFYEDLLKHFLEFSYSDARFSLFLLLPAYMNSSLGDALTMRCSLWSISTDVVRQMNIDVSQIQPLMDYVRKNLNETTQLLRGQFPDQMNVLFNFHDNAIKKGIITESRNPAIYQIAKEQLEIVKGD